MDIPALLLRHQVTIEAYAGADSFGNRLFSAAVTVTCFVDDKRQLVRASTGEEVISESTVIAPLATVCPVNSQVTLPDGRKARVLQALRRDGGGLPVPDHLEILLT